MRLAQSAGTMLETTILPFWMSLRDDEYGGYYGYMDFDYNLDRRAEKGCILNSRILWFFSRAARDTGRDDLRGHARHAYEFLTRCCLDRDRGGIFWSLHHDGTPRDTTKHTYNQAFAIYALAEYYRLTGDGEALALARSLFDLVETRCTDAKGYREAFTRDWQPESNEKLSENGVLAARTMNTLLHVFEGCAGLYQAAPDPRVARALRRILTIYADKIYSPQLQRQQVFFDEDYHSLIDLHSYGHDIESSWLIDWGCGLLQDPALSARIGAIDSSLAASVYRRGYRNHSLLNECERGINDPTRVWWVQAEAVLGFVNEFEKSGDRKYADAAADIWHYLCAHFVDRRPGGEWFWCLDENAVPIPGRPIVEPWKCPYHNGRLCLELIRRDPDVQV